MYEPFYPYISPTEYRIWYSNGYLIAKIYHPELGTKSFHKESLGWVVDFDNRKIGIPNDLDKPNLFSGDGKLVGVNNETA